MSKPVPNVDDVLRVFDGLGDKYVPVGAVRGHLEAEGFDHLATAGAINAAIEQSVLALSRQNSLYRL